METNTDTIRTEAHAIAFELIDALGIEGALRFHAEHANSPYAIMGLVDALTDHGMDLPAAIKPWRVDRMERTKVAGYPFSVGGLNLYTGERFSWSVPALCEGYDLSAVACTSQNA